MTEPDSAAPAPDSPGWWRRFIHRLRSMPRSREDVLELLREARERGWVDADAADMIRGVFETRELQARDIMVPRPQMVVMEVEWQLAKVVEAALESGHSRYPVIGESRDEVKGVLLAKDLLLQVTADERPLSEKTDADWASLVRQAVFVPESKRLNVLLRDFRKSRNHMAIVLDEYGGVAGLVTIEDVLEQIVGEIDDEYDDQKAAPILRLDERRFLVPGQTPIEEFNAYFGSDMPDVEFDTVGGLVTQKLGHLPRRGESVRVNDFQFNVHRADERRILQLHVTLSQS